MTRGKQVTGLAGHKTYRYSHESYLQVLGLDPESWTSLIDNIYMTMTSMSTPGHFDEFKERLTHLSLWKTAGSNLIEMVKQEVTTT